MSQPECLDILFLCSGQGSKRSLGPLLPSLAAAVSAA